MRENARSVIERRHQRLFAEFLGAMTLTMAVVGSGIMASRLTDDVGLQLLFNAVSTGAALAVLIWAFGLISGAHFNPAVTMVAAVRRNLRTSIAAAYIGVQVLGAVVGTALANLMFGLPAWTLSTTERAGPGVMMGEAIATAGLLVTIGLAVASGRRAALAFVVPAWIVAAYLFTSSTSFANPAVTIGRALTDTFTGIAPTDVAPFIAMQLIGAALGVLTVRYLLPEPRSTTRNPASVGMS